MKSALGGVWDYYPFGMIEPGRHLASANGYRFGFNGKERDDEAKGPGNEYDYGMRIYDTRLAKFLSTDPKTKNYPWYTPYQFAGNKPIWALDLDGAEEYYYTYSSFNKNGESMFRLHQDHAYDDWLSVALSPEPIYWLKKEGEDQEIPYRSFEEMFNAARVFATNDAEHTKAAASEQQRESNIFKGIVILGAANAANDAVGEYLSKPAEPEAMVELPSPVAMLKEREALARSFFEESGAANIENHISAIALEEEVSVSTLGAGTKLYRWSYTGQVKQGSTIPPKEYYSLDPNVDPYDVGKGSVVQNPSAWKLEEYTLNKPVKVLKSTIKLESGAKGAQQIYSPDIQNNSVKTN